ncbi:MAG: hypothetical protein HC769_07555 [Cyanobacteria bacterium CRU_2_1]|nr:hypothetical protein [Cyanobacteria bacterium RU_5_0]NJR58714.1 hypothetical protein [Cyanobacteria bacterium CRU_2_1]
MSNVLSNNDVVTISIVVWLQSGLGRLETVFRVENRTERGAITLIDFPNRSSAFFASY